MVIVNTVQRKWRRGCGGDARRGAQRPGDSAPAGEGVRIGIKLGTVASARQHVGNITASCYGRMLGPRARACDAVCTPNTRLLLSPQPARLCLQNIDGVVSRREILAAFRRNRQHADILKCPPRIRQDDGTFDIFVDRFLQVGKGTRGGTRKHEEPV